MGSTIFLSPGLRAYIVSVITNYVIAGTRKFSKQSKSEEKPLRQKLLGTYLSVRTKLVACEILRQPFYIFCAPIGHRHS